MIDRGEKSLNFIQRGEETKIRKYILVLPIIIIFGVLGGIAGKMIFAQDDITELIIGSKETQIDPIFRQDMEPLYPGHYISKTLRIKNNLEIDTVIKSIGMNINLRKDNIFLDFNDKDTQDYMEHMEMKIEYKNSLKSFTEGTIFEGTFREFLLAADCDILIQKQSKIDLVYMIGMNKSALVNIAGIESVIDFTYKIEQLIDKRIEDDENDDESDYENRDDSSEIKDIGNTWAHDCISVLLDKKIIKPYKDGSIRSEQYITRGEVAELIGRALGLEYSIDKESMYKDNLAPESKGYILKLTERGVLAGYLDGEFKSNNHITREEMVKVLVLAFNKKTDSDKELKFLDKSDISRWALGYVRDGVEHKVIEGYPDNTFRPQNNITRAEAFSIICRMLELHENHIVK